MTNKKYPHNSFQVDKIVKDIDIFESENYNLDEKGRWEENEEAISDLIDKTYDETTETKRYPLDLEDELVNIRSNSDQMEHNGILNGLLRSKSLEDFIQAAKTRRYEEYVKKDMIKRRGEKIFKTVTLEVPWFLVGDLLENLFLKYHTNHIDLMHEDIKEGLKNGIYAFWKEIPLPDENDERWGWQDGINPWDCYDLRDFMKKRVKIITEKRKIKEKLNNRSHKLRKYVSIKEYGESKPGSVYWFIDVNKRFTKYSKFNFGVLYVGESRNFDQRFSAYAIKSHDRFTELESKLSKKFPTMKKETIKKFIRDPEQCKLMVKTFKFLSDSTRRLNWERRVIKMTQPLLNKGGRFH